MFISWLPVSLWLVTVVKDLLYKDKVNTTELFFFKTQFPVVLEFHCCIFKVI